MKSVSNGTEQDTAGQLDMGEFCAKASRVLNEAIRRYDANEIDSNRIEIKGATVNFRILG